MLLTEKYQDHISSVLTCYDRMVIQGVIPGWSFSDGITSYFYANNIKIFDFQSFSKPLTQKIRDNAQAIAKENNVEIEYIRKIKAFRKDDRIQEIIKESGKTEGLIHIFSAMECCNSYKP